MTIDKSKEIAVPVWLISVVLSILFSAFVVWGSIASAKSTLDRAKTDIETLRVEKISRDEFRLVLDKLNSIDGKLDGHIEKTK